MQKELKAMPTKPTGDSEKLPWKEPRRESLLMEDIEDDIEDDMEGGSLPPENCENSEKCEKTGNIPSSFPFEATRTSYMLRSICIATLLHLAWLFFRKTDQEDEELHAKALHGFGEKDEFGCTALHVAADKGKDEEVAELIRKSSESFGEGLLSWLNARDAWDETALHMAARAGSWRCSELLLDAKADLNAQNADGKTPIMLAGEQAEELLTGMKQLKQHEKHEAPSFEAHSARSARLARYEDLCFRFLELGATMPTTEEELPQLCALTLTLKMTEKENEKKHEETLKKHEKNEENEECGT